MERRDQCAAHVDDVRRGSLAIRRAPIVLQLSPRSRTATRGSPRRSRRAAARARTGARTRRGPRGRRGGRSAARTWSSSSGAGSGERALAAAPARDALAPAAAPRPLPAASTRLGRLTAELHTPFDAFERASDARRARQPEGVRGDRARVRALPRRVPAGRGRRVAACRAVPRRTAAGRPARRASATCARRSRATSARGGEPIRRRAPSSRVLANLEIGFHEQTRLQPEIREALDAPYATQEDLGRRALEALFPSAARWWPVVRRPAAAVVGVVAARAQRACEQARARGDHGLVHGPLAARAACWRSATHLDRRRTPRRSASPPTRS